MALLSGKKMMWGKPCSTDPWYLAWTEWELTVAKLHHTSGSTGNAACQLTFWDQNMDWWKWFSEGEHSGQWWASGCCHWCRCEGCWCWGLHQWQWQEDFSNLHNLRRAPLWTRNVYKVNIYLSCYILCEIMIYIQSSSIIFNWFKAIKSFQNRLLECCRMEWNEDEAGGPKMGLCGQANQLVSFCNKKTN